MKGYMGIYLAPEGEYEIERIKSVPCVCCKNVKNKKEMFPILANHNLRELSREADRIRNLIMEGSMREYVESRRDIWNISALRLLDEEKEWMELLAPAARTSIFRVTSMESYRRAEVRRFMGRVLSRFSPKSKVFILFPCSARKPYSFSPSHRKFIRAIKDYRGSVQELIITSPLGVVPRELENVYPAAFYEIPVLGQWDAEEKKMISSCLSEFLEKNHPSRIIVHLDERYRKVCKDALENFEVKVTVSDSPTSSKSLELLKKTLDELVEKAPYKVKRIIESIADYQFGSGAGKLLDGKVLTRPLGIKGTAIINPYGLLSLTLEGARKLELLQRYQVEIDDFVPESSIFAPGVIDADPLIRVNDEVIVRGEKAFGCGRACMRGDEMVKSERGVAVKLRHVGVK
jgi:archaeosine synthase